MLHTVVIVAMIVDEDTGSVEIQYTFDGGELTNRTFPSMEGMIGWATDPIDNPEKGLTLALAWWLARDAEAGNIGLVQGKNVEIDFAAPVPVRVTG